MLFLLISLFSFADEDQLVKQFFGPDGIKNKKDAYSGEMLKYYLDRPTLGESLPAGVEVNVRALESSKERKIYAVLITKNGQSQDWYIYLVSNQGKSKISAVRSLALPNIFFTALQEAQKKTNRTKKDEYQYQNMLLTVKLDSELKEYLQKNIKLFDVIVKNAKDSPDKATEIAQSLYINFVKYQPETGIVDVNIGGILDNSVGYLYVPDGATAPRMSYENYIYLEQVNENWYVYKTT
jgi:hypothetical protein